MECLINIVAFCLLNTSNVYVTGDVDFASRPRQFANGLWEGRWCENRFCQGPIGTIRIGVQVPVSSTLILEYGFKHQSFILEDDRGEESLFVSGTWRPWRK